MKTPLYIGQRARHQKLHLLYALQKGSCLSKYYRYFSFISLVKIFCLVQNWSKKTAVIWFAYLSMLPITIRFCQTKTTLSPLYSRICRLLSLKTHRRLFAALYIPKSQPYRVFGMQNTVTRYQDVRKRCYVVFFFPWLKECLRLSLRAFRLGFRAFSA